MQTESKNRIFDILKYHPSANFFTTAAQAESVPPNASRIGGPVVDLPAEIDYPENLFFVAQINLSQIPSGFSKPQLLPSDGFLYFFYNSFTDHKNTAQVGQVFFTNCPASDLKRTVKVHENWFWEGKMIDRITAETERFSDHYAVSNAAISNQIDEAAEMTWDYFAGMEITKSFGISNNPQAGEEEILNGLDSGQIVLLQIGENFTEEGILTVLIQQHDLSRRDFSRCVFNWRNS